MTMQYAGEPMRRRDRGFTLVEVLISLFILAVVMEAVSTFFLGTMQTYKQQSRVVQSGMESVIGLEMLRKDIGNAGYGLPWNNLPAAYNEAASGILNDSPNSVPRGIVSVAGGGLNGSDYLVIKASVVGTDIASKKWTTLQAGDVTRSWTTVPANVENLIGTDRVIVMSPGGTGTNWRTLVINGGNWSTTFGALAGFGPTDVADTRLIYGIDGGAGLRMPFNRADYYIDTTSVPQKCAPNTGVLVKRVVRHVNGALDTALPLLDCVASMQVLYMLDTDGDGDVDNTSNDISAFTATQIRAQVKAVRTYILAQEGQLDPGYVQSPSWIYVGDPSIGGGDNVDLLAVPGDRWLNYRWKLYSLAVETPNLGD